MKLAVITTSAVPAPQAHSIQAVKVSAALQQAGAQVRMWVPGNPSPAERDGGHLAAHYGLSQPLDIHWLPSLRALRRYDFVLRAHLAAMRWGADAVYTWLPASVLLARSANLPAYLEIHDTPSGALGPSMMRRIVQRPVHTRFIITTRALQRKLEQLLGHTLPPDQVVIAPNGIDLSQYADLPTPTEARKALGLPERFTAVYTGHFYAGRGMELLLELARAIPQAQFVWAGGMPQDVAEWHARLQAAGVTNVTLPGFLPNRDLPLWQAAGEVLLMPYEWRVEVSGGGNTADICSPMKMFEYLAAGRAILSSDLPVLHEVLNEGNAVFCPPESVQAWVSALSDLMADPERCQRLGMHARRDGQQYSWQARVHRILVTG